MKIIDVTMGECTLRCHYTEHRHRPATLTDPEEPGGIEVERVELVHSIAEDLGPAGAPPRQLLIEVGQLIDALGGDEALYDKIYDELAGSEPDEPDEPDFDESDFHLDQEDS